jgi:hypothetical protein
MEEIQLNQSRTVHTSTQTVQHSTIPHTPAIYALRRAWPGRTGPWVDSSCDRPPQLSRSCLRHTSCRCVDCMRRRGNGGEGSEVRVGKEEM